MKKNKVSPDYRKIFCDILDIKYPQKKDACCLLLQKESLTELDIIELNRIIFGVKNKKTEVFNQRHKSYGKSAILKMLEYQREHCLNNTQLALHFKLSRNTVMNWKKSFLLT